MYKKEKNWYRLKIHCTNIMCLFDVIIDMIVIKFIEFCCVGLEQRDRQRPMVIFYVMPGTWRAAAAGPPPLSYW